MKIAVVDYGSGNLRSVYQAIKKVAPLNSDVWVTEDPNKVKEADRVISQKLPFWTEGRAEQQSGAISP